MLRPSLTLCAVALGCATGCVYPRHSTPLIAVMQAPVDRATQPEDLWRLSVVAVEVPREKRTGLSWDDDGNAPDPYLVLRIADRQAWRSPVVEDSFEPAFPPPSSNLAFERTARLRFELWDNDGVGADPIGMYEGRAFSESILGADTTIKLDSGASVTLRLDKPEPKQGVGISDYELRPSAVVVRGIAPNSPASRAKLKLDDRIVAIDGKAISAFGPQQAESALALAAQNQSELRVQRGKSQLKVKLDNGYVWPAL
jgi:hypothetical protein